MDKKRNILIRELMGLIDEAKDIQEEIDKTFTYAYQCLVFYGCPPVSHIGDHSSCKFGNSECVPDSGSPEDPA